VTYTRNGRDLIAGGCVIMKGCTKVEIPESKMQICCPESDSRIRAMIRGMDDRERMIIQDELDKINGEAPTLGYRVFEDKCQRYG